jgi:hypothetical protein
MISAYSSRALICKGGSVGGFSAGNGARDVFSKAFYRYI